MITEGINPTAADGENNPLDLRVSTIPWRGKLAPVPGQQFERFTEMWYGYRAGILTVQAHFREGQKTLNLLFGGSPGPGRTVIPGFAPAKDGNNPVQYALNVAGAAGIDPNADLTSYINNGLTMQKIASAMAMEEQGDKFIVNPDDLACAWMYI